ncbi:MAG: hypothetical protein ACFE9Z_01610 [Promethearchaeota archaeon]
MVAGVWIAFNFRGDIEHMGYVERDFADWSGIYGVVLHTIVLWWVSSDCGWGVCGDYWRVSEELMRV